MARFSILSINPWGSCTFAHSPEEARENRELRRALNSRFGNGVAGNSDTRIHVVNRPLICTYTVPCQLNRRIYEGLYFTATLGPLERHKMGMAF